ncbi:hypothetical protein [Chryseobacterium scophthalmum]|uniref:hypothetical protein n=1 Tax=Chryseobacterium scophthalmum TaxID=59733 RepID=UPI003D024B03
MKKTFLSLRTACNVLSDVKKLISLNKYLPETPSAEEVVKNGRVERNECITSKKMKS